MSSIDERIVQMEFDNAQFEKGLATSIKSLDGLKAGLDFGDISSLDDLVDKMGLTGIADSLDNISGKFTTMGAVAFSVIMNLTNAALDFGKGALAGLLDPIISGGQKRALAIEQAKFQFRGLGMDIQATMDAALYAVKGTAFGLDEAASAAANLGASRVPIEQMGTALRGISGVAALAGASYSDVADVFTKVAGQGRLMADDLNRLASRGVNAAATLANSMGITESEVREMVTKGKIDFQTFATLMDEAFGENATKASDTFSGAMSNMRAALSRIGAAFASTDFEGQRLILNAFTPLIDQLAKSLGPVVELFAGMTWEGAEKLVKIMEALNFSDIPDQPPVFFQALNNIIGFIVGNVNLLRQAFQTVFPGDVVSTVMNFVNGFKSLTDNLVMSEDTMGRVRYIFEQFFRGIKAGVDLVVDIFNRFKAAFDRVFEGPNLTSITVFAEGFRRFMQSLELTSTAGAYLEQVFGGIFAVFEIVGMVIKGAVGLFGRLIGKIFEGTGSALQFSGGIGLFLMNLRDMLKEGGGIEKFFQTLGDILVKPIDFLKDLAKWLGEAAVNVGKFFGKLVNVESFKNGFAKIGEFFGKIKEFFTPSEDMAGMGEGIGQAIEGAFRAINFETISQILSTGIVAAVGGAIFLVIQKIKGFFENFGGGTGILDYLTGGLADNIKGVFDTLTSTMENMQAKLKSDMLRNIAIAIAILAGAVLILSFIEPQRLYNSLAAIAVMGIILSGIVVALDKYVAFTSKTKMPIVAGSLILLGAALVIFAAAAKIFASMSWEDLAKGLVGFVGSIATVMAVLFGIGKLTDPKAMAQTAAVAGGLLILALAFLGFGLAMKLLATLSWDDIARAMSQMVGVLAIIFIVSKIAQNSRTGAVAMFIVSAALTVLGTALTIMAKLSWDEIGRGLAILAGALIIMGYGLVAIQGSIRGAFAAVIVSGAMIVLAKALQEFAKMSWDEILRALVVMAGGLVILAGAMALMGFPLVMAGSIGILAASAAMMMLAPALKLLGTMSWDDIGRGLTMLAASLVILALGGLLLIVALPGFLGLGLAILMIGTGALLAAVGLTMIGAAILTLVGAATVGMAVIGDLIMKVIEFIPAAMTAFADGLIQFAVRITEGGAEFAAAMTTLLTALLDAIDAIGPKAIEVMSNLMNKFMDTIEKDLPKFTEQGLRMIELILIAIGMKAGALAEAGMNIIINVINGIGNRIDDLLEAGRRVILKFMDGLEEIIPELADRGGKMVIKVIDGVTAAVNNNSGEIGRAGGDLGWALINGMANAITNGLGTIGQRAWELGQRALSSLQSALDSHSPSRETYKLGTYFNDGFGNAITDGSGKVEKKAADVGNSALAAMKDALKKPSDMFSDLVDASPVIRPKLDLSSVRKDASGLSGILTPDVLRAKNSYAAASTVSREVRDAVAEARAQQQGQKSGDTYVSFKYDQTLNSPKAISRVEAYRQTENQLSSVKGALKKFHDRGSSFGTPG